MTSRPLLTGTALALVLSSAGGCAAFSGADDATTPPSASAPTNSARPRTTAPTTSPTDPASTTASGTSEGPARSVIRTMRAHYFGQPFETIRIRGTYDGVERAASLRLQVLDDGRWQTYPLPVLTSDSGRFSAYVELASGQYRVRLVELATGQRSQAVTVLVF